jgi:hypothetical protein
VVVKISESREFLDEPCVKAMSGEGAPADKTLSFDEVLAADAEWTAKEKAVGFDNAAEGAALKRLLEGERSAALASACASVGQDAQLESARVSWASWSELDARELGAEVAAVVERLEAPHLRPTGIEERLLSGVAPACYGASPPHPRTIPARVLAQQAAVIGAARLPARARLRLGVTLWRP